MNAEKVAEETIVTPAGHGKFEQKITTGQHILIADEPLTYGGSDKGPSPYDFILAGLGACTSMTLKLYAELKKIPLKDVVVRLTHSKIHAVDCEECTDKSSKMDTIERKIELKGHLNDEQKQKLLDIANKCPVHQTLTSKILIKTEIV